MNDPDLDAVLADSRPATDDDVPPEFMAWVRSQVECRDCVQPDATIEPPAVEEYDLDDILTGDA